MERKIKRTVRSVTGKAGGSGKCADNGVFEEIPAPGRRRRRERSGSCIRRRRRRKRSRSCIGAEESLRYG